MTLNFQKTIPQILTKLIPKIIFDRVILEMVCLNNFIKTHEIIIKGTVETKISTILKNDC